MQGTFVPSVRWDFTHSNSLEEMWFSDALVFSMSGRTLARWKNVNSNQTLAVEFLAEKTRKAGKRVQMTQESETWWSELTEFVFQLQYGPSRVWLSFIEVKDIYQNASDDGSGDFESDVSGGSLPHTNVVPQEGERSLAMKERWLSLILCGNKTMELRGRNAQLGPFWLTLQDKIYGRADIVRTEKLNVKTFEENRVKHCWEGQLPYENTWGYWLENVETLQDPVPFKKRHGSITWSVIRFGNEWDGVQSDHEEPAEESIKTPCEDLTPEATRTKGTDDVTPKRCNAVATEVETLCEDEGAGVGGLTNVGNTCFVNSVLQSLYSSRNIQDLLRSHQCCESDAAICLKCLLRETAEHRGKNKADAAVMKKWEKLLTKFGFEAGAQDSALAFCALVIGQLDPTEMVFHTKATRCVKHMCQHEDCVQYLAEKMTEQKETWPLVYLENPEKGRKHIEDLLERAREGEIRKDGLKCEACDSWKEVKEDFVFDHWPNLLICAFPRSGEVVGDRQQRNNEPIVCEDVIKVDQTRHRLLALVEHYAAHAGSADLGHYVAWLRCSENNCWYRADDARVEERLWLDHTVEKNTALAYYEKLEADASSTEPAEGTEAEKDKDNEEGQRLQRASCNVSFLDLCFGSRIEELDCDGQFERLAAAFFAELAGAKTVAKIMKNFPAQLSCWSAFTLEQSVEMLKVGLKNVKHESLCAEAEVDVFVPLWRTMPLRLALIFDALSKALSLPMVMLWDSFKVVLSSLLHKSVGVRWQEYEIRHRYWSVVTSDPGAGKSHALGFIMNCLLTAMEDPQHHKYFPGCAEDNFHIVHDGTHAAFATRLNRANGCALLASPEGTTVLCPKFPATGEFAKSSHIDLERCLEGAGGGNIHWDTQESVLNKAKNARKNEQAPDKGVHWDQTNFAFIFFQQISML